MSDQGDNDEPAINPDDIEEGDVTIFLKQKILKKNPKICQCHKFSKLTKIFKFFI